MQALATILSPLITKLITDGLKLPVPKFSPGRVALIRFVLALVSIAIAFLSSWLFGNPFDNSLIGIFVDTLINFIGASGIFHLTTKS